MATMEELLDIMRRLRDPATGCPWDREQTYATIVPYTLEEAYEVADAIERGDIEDLRGELGDLLFQVVFFAQIAQEAGHFAFSDVTRGIVDKLVSRHPHVFGEARIETAAQQSEAWEQHKARERVARQAESETAASVLDGVTLGLPAASRGAKLQRRAARVGFDWTSMRDILTKIGEELEEVRAEIDAGSDRARLTHEIGDLMFACINLARFAEIDPEAAMRQANQRFERRFRRIESLLAERGRQPQTSTLDEMESLWKQAKSEGL